MNALAHSGTPCVSVSLSRFAHNFSHTLSRHTRTYTRTYTHTRPATAAGWCSVTRWCTLAGLVSLYHSIYGPRTSRSLKGEAALRKIIIIKQNILMCTCIKHINTFSVTLARIILMCSASINLLCENDPHVCIVSMKSIFHIHSSTLCYDLG